MAFAVHPGRNFELYAAVSHDANLEQAAFPGRWTVGDIHLPETGAYVEMGKRPSCCALDRIAREAARRHHARAIDNTPTAGEPAARKLQRLVPFDVM